jgi:hypothetical protein
VSKQIRRIKPSSKLAISPPLPTTCGFMKVVTRRSDLDPDHSQCCTIFYFTWVFICVVHLAGRHLGLDSGHTNVVLILFY